MMPAKLAMEPTDRSTAPQMTSSASGIDTTPSAETASPTLRAFARVRKCSFAKLKKMIRMTRPTSVPFRASANWTSPGEFRRRHVTAPGMIFRAAFMQPVG